MSALPNIELVRSLPTYLDQSVPDEFIDQNGHMNINDYFRLATWAPWKRMIELGVDDDYTPVRGLTFFTVEHRLRYLCELRLGEHFSITVGFAGRTSKALLAAAFVVDEARDRISCVAEVKYVHISWETRRATDIPDDIATALDDEMAAHPWVADAVTGLSLAR